MADQNVYSKSDPAMQQALAALEGHVESMIRAANQVEAIRENISRVYVAGSSTTFQTKMNDWVEHYNTVMRAFQRLGDDTGSVNQLINNAEDDANVTALTLSISSALTS